MRLVLFVSLIIALAAVVFALQNPGEMTLVVPLTGFTIAGSQPVILISTLIIGLIIGLLASLPGRIGVGLRARKAEKKLEEIAKTIAHDSPVAKVVDPAPPADTSPAPMQDANETQRLAEEVARRTEAAQQSGPPPLDP